jgi:uncharacterized membrane protein YfcA
MVPTRGILAFGIYLALGAFVGVFSGLFGVGGGIVMVPFLVLLSGQNQQMAQGISLAVMVPTALANSLRYARSGNMDLWIALAIALGAVPAGYLFGADIAQRLPAKTLQTLFALFMVAVAVRMMPTASFRSMGALLGALIIAIGVRLVMGR